VYSNACGESSLVDQEVVFSPIPETPTITLTGDGELTTAVIADLYTWFLDGVEIAGATTATIIPSGFGTYEVIAINADVCQSNISEGFSYDPTRTFEGVEQFVKVFPQPAGSILNIELPVNLVSESIEILDLQGRLMIQIPTNKQQKVTIPTDALPSGMYFLKVNQITRSIVIGQ
jgi:hypothetical protein